MATIHYTYAPGTSFHQILGFEMAGKIWSSHLQDDVTINIYVEGTDQLSQSVLGGALPGMVEQQAYSQIRGSLLSDYTSVEDKWAINSLSSKPDFSISAHGDQHIHHNSTLNLTSANAKAMGLIQPMESQLDGYILFNDFSNQSAFEWSYDFARTAPPVAHSFDFLSVALHETGHILGFTSGVDAPNWLNTILGANGGEMKDGAMTDAHPLDLFRYSKASAALGQQDLSIGTEAYFSLDQGKSALAQFATGVNTTLGGDGYQASHWQQSDRILGIMDPILRPGEQRHITTLDRTALDVIGWDLAPASEIQTITPVKIASEVKAISLLDDAHQKPGLNVPRSRTGAFYNASMVKPSLGEPQSLAMPAAPSLSIWEETLRQVKAELAREWSTSVAWLDANPESAAAHLTQDNFNAVVNMVGEDWYEWGRGSRGRYRQEMLQWFEQNALFTTQDVEATTDELSGAIVTAPAATVSASSSRPPQRTTPVRKAPGIQSILFAQPQGKPGQDAFNANRGATVPARSLNLAVPFQTYTSGVGDTRSLSNVLLPQGLAPTQLHGEIDADGLLLTRGEAIVETIL